MASQSGVMATAAVGATPTQPATAATGPKGNFEPAALFWLILGGVWTALVVGGMAFLYANRNIPFLRIRGLVLSFGAVILLHLYLIAVHIGLCIGEYIPGAAEFWVMGIWLPFGIALFHASNTRFLHVAQAQKRFLEGNVVSPRSDAKPCGCKRKSLLFRFRRLDHTTRMLALVSAGMLFQLFLTAFMFLISRKYHPSFGLPGTELTGTPMERKANGGRGWEWWPSVFWQFFWAWLVAPVILWKARGIEDTQGWRFQTIACCVANLHATPMWLVALYVPAMAPVNKYFIPPQWIGMSIMFIEIFTIFIPCWQVLRHQSLRQETLETIALWEAKNKSGSIVTGDSAVTKVGTAPSVSWKSVSSLEKEIGADSIFTMGALEHVLEKNPEPLRKFSALKDFSGENIAFLVNVAEWKSSLPRGGMQLPELVRARFNRALHIYIDYVSPHHAEFPINLASQDLKKLESVFADIARKLYGDQPQNYCDPATPWNDFLPSNGSEKQVVAHDGSADRIEYWGEIPGGYSDTVFDDAETSIKYLVLTNTWPKFVKVGRASLDSEDSRDTTESYDSTSTLMRVKKYFRTMKSTGYAT